MCIGEVILVGGGIIAQIKVPCTVALRNSVRSGPEVLFMSNSKSVNNCFLLRQLFRLFQLFMTVLAYGTITL